MILLSWQLWFLIFCWELNSLFYRPPTQVIYPLQSTMEPNTLFTFNSIQFDDTFLNFSLFRLPKSLGNISKKSSFQKGKKNLIATSKKFGHFDLLAWGIQHLHAEFSRLKWFCFKIFFQKGFYGSNGPFLFTWSLYLAT